MPDDIQPNDQDIVGTGSPLPAIGIATIDAPERTDGGYGNHLKLEARSVKTVDHAWNICKATEQNNRTRAARTADIQALHDGEPPRSSAAQTERGKAWQSNASTNWLAGIVGRVSQRFVNAVISQIYVTSSALPQNNNNAKAKTDLLRAKFTRLIRSWDGNTGLINSLAVETALQGYAYAVFLDPYTYKPTMFKQDRAFCPEQSGQHARDLQFFVAKMDYRLDEFLDLFKDEEAAKEVGYDLDNCVYAANNARMMDPREDATTTQFRKFVEMMNEGVLGLTFTSTGARVVSCWLLFNREYDGQVSFWLIHRDSGKMLRFSFKLFPKMQDVLAMFSFEPGNGCIHSSKGLGRKLASLTIMKELFRNGIIDNSRMSGLMILRADSKDKSKFAPAVMSPFIVLDKSIEIPQQQFIANSESYKVTDVQIDGWAEQSVGAYLAAQISPTGRSDKTATEAQIDARRESEAADIMIRRWIDQFANLTQIQQKRAFSDDYIDEARRLTNKLIEDPELEKPDFYEGHGHSDPEVLRSLVEIMLDPLQITDDEIKIWRETPASPLAHTADAVTAQGVSIVLQKYAGNPNVDQGKVIQRDIENTVGAELAQEFFIPVADQTIVAEAKRMQLIESNTMLTAGLEVPVSPRDNHLIHGQTVQELLTAVAAPVLSQPNPPPQILKAAELNLNHLLAHLQIGASMGMDKDPNFRELEKFALGFKKQLTEVVQINEEMQAAQQVVMDTIRREGLPPEVPAEVPALETAPAVPEIPATAPTGEAPALANVPS
jgi:hypothetical protein